MLQQSGRNSNNQYWIREPRIPSANDLRPGDRVKAVGRIGDGGFEDGVSLFSTMVRYMDPEWKDENGKKHKYKEIMIPGGQITKMARLPFDGDAPIQFLNYDQWLESTAEKDDRQIFYGEIGSTNAEGDLTIKNLFFSGPAAPPPL